MAEKQPRRFRFILRMILLVGALLIAGVVLLKSDRGGRWVLRHLGNRMGLEITANRVNFDFDGHVRISRLSARVEDEQEPFLTARTLSITMSSLKTLLRTWELRVSDISVTDPVLTLRRDEQGRMNIDPLRTRWANRPKRSGRSAIPALAIINGTLHFEQAGQVPVEVSNVALTSTTDHAGRLKAALAVAKENTVDALFDPKTLDHTLSVDMKDIAALPEIIQKPLRDVQKLKARWTGRIVSLKPWDISGQLSIEDIGVHGIQGSLQSTVALNADKFLAEIKQFSVDPRSLWEQIEDSPPALTADQGIIRYKFSENRLDIEDLAVTLLEGKATVAATVFVKQPQQTTASIEFSEIHPAPLLKGDLVEDMVLSGVFNVGPALDKRAMEPMAISLRLRVIGQLFQTAGLGEITAEGYLGNSRLVTQTVTIPAFSGVILPWLNLTRRENELFTHFIADFEHLDIDRVVHTFNAEAQPASGLLSGTVRCRSLGNLQTLSGSADIILSESDLVKMKIIGAVYEAMNLNFGQKRPQGQGQLKVSVQGHKVDIMSFEYFNQGTEIRGAGEIHDITMGKNSPVSGFLTGSMQPLRDSKIPGMKELDRMIKGLQAGLAAVRIEGTLGDPQPQVVALPEIQNALRALLWQQLKEE